MLCLGTVRYNNCVAMTADEFGENRCEGMDAKVRFIGMSVF